MIAIINYYMGNLQSVANILDYLREPNIITNSPAEIATADKIILPGVGAFGEAMANLHKLNLVPLLKQEVLEKKKPFLGICLGLQLLADKGYEGGENAGLGIVPGEVRRLTPNDSDLPIPHIGWNEVEAVRPSVLFPEPAKRKVFYFVHSFHFIAADPSCISGVVDYGGKVVASIERDNVFATQFHPEKSQRDGIELLRHFLAYQQNS